MSLIPRMYDVEFADKSKITTKAYDASDAILQALIEWAFLNPDMPALEIRQIQASDPINPLDFMNNLFSKAKGTK